MPSPEALLTELGAIANDWRWLAIAWHVAFAGLFFALLVGWRPPARLLGLILGAPLLSVSVIGWLSGNPFNGMMFAALAAALIWSMARLDNTSVTLAQSAWVAAAYGVTLFGWAYPHFVRADSWVTYLYASPFGILPCPTLTVVIGLTLTFPHLTARSWQSALMVTGLLYGGIGVFRLGVLLDWGLLLASAMLCAVVARNRAASDHTARGAWRAPSWIRSTLV